MVTSDINFVCWATQASGILHRIEIRATTNRDAVRRAFQACPGATAVSCVARGGSQHG